MENAGIDIEVIYFDSDLVELRVSACNGVFRGQTDLYVDHEAISELAESLAGFPRSATESYLHELGNFDPDHGGGGARLAFAPLDRVGHYRVTVTLRTDPSLGLCGESTAQFPLQVEPAAIDSFASSLSAMKIQIGASVHLKMQNSA